MTPVSFVRDGATVMLVRDGAHPEPSIEVFMMRRHPGTAFGSVHVFPGGVVEPADAAPELDARCPGLSDPQASMRLGVPAGGRAFWVAALRECFEEAGVLLARTAAGERLQVDHDPARRERFDEHRRALHTGSSSLLDVLLAEDLVLSVDEVHYFSHWITPIGAPKRFDTRFFLARAPEGQTFAHDARELIGSEWVRPADALRRHQAGGFAMIEPTIRSLEEIGRFATCDELLAAHDPAATAVETSGG